MFKECSPESAGIPSKKVLKFIKALEEKGFSVHNILLSRGDKLFCECYYAPFHKDYLHRMYSVTKSFVALAIGCLEEEGKLSLDDKLVKFFPEYDTENKGRLDELTIRDMLKMNTSRSKGLNWFGEIRKMEKSDRTATYFMMEHNRIPGTFYEYDSDGSYMLGVVAEKLCGKPFMEYLKDKFLSKIGFSKDAYCLKAPGGYSWGDSALMCKPMDLMRTVRFIANKGLWKGERLMNEKFLTDASSVQTQQNIYGFRNYNSYGYGYQIWKTKNDGFFFNGMGGQYCVYDPVSDIVFEINEDTQGDDFALNLVFSDFFNIIADNAGEQLPENPEDYKELCDYIATRKLYSLDGKTDSSWKEKIDGVTYTSESSLMKWFRFDFDGDKATLTYFNDRGEMKLDIGFGHNEFQLFPEEGYSDEVGGLCCEGNKYKCAVSGEWCEEAKMRIRVQIVDKYFANLGMFFSFKGDEVFVITEKRAEDFMREYSTNFIGRKQR